MKNQQEKIKELMNIKFKNPEEIEVPGKEENKNLPVNAKVYELIPADVRLLLSQEALQVLSWAYAFQPKTEDEIIKFISQKHMELPYPQFRAINIIYSKCFLR